MARANATNVAKRQLELLFTRSRRAQLFDFPPYFIVQESPSSHSTDVSFLRPRVQPPESSRGWFFVVKVFFEAFLGEPGTDKLIHLRSGQWPWQLSFRLVSLPPPHDRQQLASGSYKRRDSLHRLCPNLRQEAPAPYLPRKQNQTSAPIPPAAETSPPLDSSLRSCGNRLRAIRIAVSEISKAVVSNPHAANCSASSPSPHAITSAFFPSVACGFALQNSMRPEFAPRSAHGTTLLPCFRLLVKDFEPSRRIALLADTPPPTPVLFSGLS